MRNHLFCAMIAPSCLWGVDASAYRVWMGTHLATHTMSEGGAVGPPDPRLQIGYTARVGAPHPSGIRRKPDGAVGVNATGVVGAPYRYWASTCLAQRTGTLLGAGTVVQNPFVVLDATATNRAARCYRFSTL